MSVVYDVLLALDLVGLATNDQGSGRPVDKFSGYHRICVSGDNKLENLCRGDQIWKVRLIEKEFGRLLFDVKDV